MRNFQRRIFYSGIIMISIFEILNVYFIMPMPGSQELNSLDLAYFLYTNKWYIRIFSGVLIIAGLIPFRGNKPGILPVLSIMVAIFITYLFNFHMTAEKMFKQPEELVFKPKAGNMVSDSSIVMCVENNGQVKAYPIQFLAYHHQVQDTIGNLSVIITYCSVCRTGRIYLPEVRGKSEKFRLVGMDHYNAMFEDATTKSWWRQATGEAVAGPMSGEVLITTGFTQITIKKLFELYPHAIVMQADESAIENYDITRKFEQGKSKGRLTRSDTISWGEKSWVIGIKEGLETRVYDWNYLKKQRIINDKIGNKPIIIALSDDAQSFAAFERPDDSVLFTLQNDTLSGGGKAYDFSGNSLGKDKLKLNKIIAFQEFWHSWNTFHPESIIVKTPGN